jgi:hypothetical protein
MPKTEIPSQKYKQMASHQTLTQPNIYTCSEIDNPCSSKRTNMINYKFAIIQHAEYEIAVHLLAINYSLNLAKKPNFQLADITIITLHEKL